MSLQQSSSQYKSSPSPVSHNVRHSLNLENLSLHDKQNDEVTYENDVFHSSQDLYPVNAIIAANSKTSSSQKCGIHQCTFIATQAVPTNHFIRSDREKLAVTCKKSTSAGGDLVASPASTVSSRTAPFAHGQNTFNSTDSSGYSSSNIDAFDHVQNMKKGITKSAAQSLLVNINGTKHEEYCNSGEDCPEVVASEFSFRMASPTLASPPNKNPLFVFNKFTTTTEQLSNASQKAGQESAPPIPAPRTRFTLRQTSPPSGSQAKISDPWLRRVPVMDAVENDGTSQPHPVVKRKFSAPKALPGLPKEKSILSRSKSERTPTITSQDPTEFQIFPVSPIEKQLSIPESKS